MRRICSLGRYVPCGITLGRHIGSDLTDGLRSEGVHGDEPLSIALPSRRAGHATPSRGHDGSAHGGRAWTAALSSAFQLNRSAMYEAARLICGDDGAADVIQDVFAQVWRNPRRFDSNSGTLRQYLLDTTRGVALDHMRREDIGTAGETRHDGEPDAGQVDPARRLIDHDTSARVVAALGRLDELERRAIMEALYNGLTYRDVAVRLGISESTAKTRIRVGLTKLRIDLRS